MLLRHLYQRSVVAKNQEKGVTSPKHDSASYLDNHVSVFPEIRLKMLLNKKEQQIYYEQ